ncbi:MAG: hypothetical protein CO034_01380 [Parcubacteria group bacterium CG_4_9_14_0_2_um_filter_35_11]|nr:MAG: hypothetical protein CO034_01380 [Parcubacteria group bacterium CG_4_9_14_0_2_um_filter_35_11]
MIKKSKISVVIARSRNSYVQTVESLKGQACEVIVVDGTKGLSYARNEGVKKANNEIICFLDDGAVAHPNYINDLTEEFIRTGAEIIGGLVLPLGEIPLWFPFEMHAMLAVSPVSREIYGCNLAVRKEVFKKINFRFNERLGRKKGNLASGEESELLSLAKEAGIKIHRSNKAIVYHRVTDERRTYRYFVRRVFWEGRTQILREKFIKHLFLGVATMVISFFRWLIYATSFAFYIYGALYQFILAKINKTKN